MTDWTAPKVRPAAKNLSGAAGGDHRRLTDADVHRQARLAQHGGCVDHVKVAGIHNPVCVLRGQDPAVVAAEAAEAAALADLGGDR